MAEPKKSKKQVKAEVARLLADIQAEREEARQRGLMFSCLSKKELVLKVRGVTSSSPFIYSQVWTGGGAPNANVTYRVQVENPDPSDYMPFYTTIFFGLGNIQSIDQAWNGRDARWPSVSSSWVNFLAGTTRTFTFDFTIPAGLTPGTYIGNSVIWQGEYHDVGTAFDRGSFHMSVH